MAKDSTLYWLALKQVKRLPLSIKLKLVEQFSITSLFSQPKSVLQDVGLSLTQAEAIVRPNWAEIDAIYQACVNHKINILAIDNHAYPALLKQITDPPLVLFTQGNIASLNLPQLAIVGSRNASIYGRDVSQQLAFELAQHQVVVTSGLALGIDAFAHRGALDAQGKTIAVVATGLDTVYPARHKALANEILAKEGCIISEFLPGIPAKPGHFPKRNRIISGLSLGTLVIEAALKSGSLITARTALEQNRDVFAVPGSIFNQQNQGCHWLIQQGAKLVTSLDDIKEELPDLFSHNKLDVADTDKVKKNTTKHLLNDPLLANVGYETTPVEIIVSRSKQPIETVLTRLTILELSGLVSAVPGGYQRVNRG